MRCEKLDHIRHLRVSALPQRIEELRNNVESLDIEIDYVGNRSALKAIILDNVIIPAIIKTLNQDSNKGA